MKNIIIAILFISCYVFNQEAIAQKISIKPAVEICLGSPLSFDSSLNYLNSKSSSAEFGVDFGYTFFTKTNNRLEMNIGLGYRYINSKLNAGDFGYDYAATAPADMDGNAYTRFCEVGGLEQTVNTAYITIPIYLQYAYRATNWLEVQALVGVKLGFNTGSTAKTTSGSVYSYGVFPEYDNLMIDAPYLDDFGNVQLAGKESDAKANTFACWGLVGAGVSGHIYGPLWIDIGVRYNIGFSDVFKKGLSISNDRFTADTAPVTYTVANGTQVKPLSDYLTRSTLSLLSLNIGLTLRF